MTTANEIISISWLCFTAYWLISAGFSKRTAARAPWWGSGFGVAAFVIVTICLVHQPGVRRQMSHLLAVHGGMLSSPIAQGAGIALCYLGMAIAIWARIYLGRNWGQPMTMREGHELVTTGPYRLVRHPIYTGAIVATFGTARAQSLYLLIPFAALWAYYAVSAVNEEKLMLRQFPDQYPRYMNETKMLIPFVF